LREALLKLFDLLRFDRQAGGKIVLLNCQENVAFLMRLARLDAVFELDEGNPPEIPPASPPEG
jgi:anti-anti-sigma regulatory factor